MECSQKEIKGEYHMQVWRNLVDEVSKKEGKLDLWDPIGWFESLWRYQSTVWEDIRTDPEWDTATHEYSTGWVRHGP